MRRYLEGRRQLVKDKKHARKQSSTTSASPNITSRKQRLKAGQQAERNRLLEDINDEFSG